MTLQRPLNVVSRQGRPSVDVALGFGKSHVENGRTNNPRRFPVVF